MLNVLYPDIGWSNIKYIGFDLDGTLYDEFEFIIQTYKNIILKNNKFFRIEDQTEILKFMTERWLQKGSSYNRIFGETFDQYVTCDISFRKKFIDNALSIFRTCIPDMLLPERNGAILSYIKKNSYNIFLITDGNVELQSQKIRSLGLDKVFNNNNIFFTHKFGSKYEKPSVTILKYINISSSPDQVVYVGDREVDQLFAKNAGFKFLKVYNLIYCR